jgi:hypothetical protein
MNQILVGIVSVVSFAAMTFAQTVIRDHFTIGEGDNTDAARIAGTVTDIGNVIWRSNASGNWRMMQQVGQGGGAVSQNNMPGSNPRLYLDYAPIMDANKATTLSLKAQVTDCMQMEFGFGSDDNLMSGSASAFWVKILENGTVTFYARGNGQVMNLGGAKVAASKDDLLKISLTYNSSANQVSGQVVGGAGTATLEPAVLPFTPVFDQFNFELREEGGVRPFAGYFDEVEVRVDALEILG